MLTAMTTQPSVVLKKLSPEEIQMSLQLSLKLGPPKAEIQGHTSLQCIINFIYLQKTHVYRLSEETLPVPVQPPDDPSKAMDMPRTMVANFGSMYKITPSDTQAQ